MSEAPKKIWIDADIARTAFPNARSSDDVVYVQPNVVIDECINVIKLGMARDGHKTIHYKQSMRHIKDLEALKLEAK